MGYESINDVLPASVRSVLIELGALIAASRKEKGFTQAHLAKRIGVGRMTIARMEHGAPEIAFGYYLTAAWVLGLPLFSWSNFAVPRVDTTIGNILKGFNNQLPARMRKEKGDIDNDF